MELLAMADQGRAGYSIVDYSKETARSEMNVGVVTALSLPGLLTNLGNFETALAGVIIGAISAKRLSVYDNPTGAAFPTNVYAQREIRWIVHYHDNTAAFGAVANPAFGRKYTVEYACPDASLLQPHTDLMDLTATNAAAFVTAFEAAFLAPMGGAAAIDFIELVGRKG
jgi:hypothetical protein